jgi:hypothetical protein
MAKRDESTKGESESEGIQSAEIPLSESTQSETSSLEIKPLDITEPEILESPKRISPMPKSPNEKSTHTISFRVDQSEYDEIYLQAALRKITVTQLAKEAMDYYMRNLDRMDKEKGRVVRKLAIENDVVLEFNE